MADFDEAAKEMAALRLMLRLGEAAPGLSTTPHTRPHVIAGPRSSKTSLGMISTPLIWPVRKKPDPLARPQERPVIYLTKPPIPTNTSPKTKAATTLSVSRKTNLVSKGDIHSEVALPWQLAETQSGSEDVEHFQVASLGNRKNKPLAPHWALTVSTENSTMNWTDSLEYSSGVEPFIYDIELGEEPFGLYDFELPYSLDESLAVDAAHLADALSAMGISAESLDPGEVENPLSNQPDPHLHWDPMPGDSARRPPSGWMPIRFDGVPGGTGVQTDPSGPSRIGTATPETSARLHRGPSQHQTSNPWTPSVPSQPSVLGDYEELSTGTVYPHVETETQTEAPLANSSDGQLKDQTADPSDNLESSLHSLRKYSSSAVTEATSPFSRISSSEWERAPLSDSTHVRPSQTNTPHLRSSEAILTPAIEIQSDLLITEASRLHPLSLSSLSDPFLAFAHGSADIRHSSAHKGHGDSVLPSLTEQSASRVRPHFEDSEPALPVDTVPSAPDGNTAVIMSATSGGSRLDSSAVLEDSYVNGSPKTLLSSLKGHYGRPSESDMRWLTHSGHISASDIAEAPHKATAALGDKLPAFQSSPFNAISKTTEGENDIWPTFSIPPHLSQTGFLYESLFSELVSNASATAEEEKPQGVESYLTEAEVNMSLSNGSQGGSLSQTHLLQPSYSGPVANQAPNTWQGTSQAHDDDFTRLSETKRLPFLLNPSPTPLEPHRVSLSGSGEALSHEPQGSAHMGSLNMTSPHILLGSVTHLSARDFLPDLHSSMTFRSTVAIPDGSERSSDQAVTRPPRSNEVEPTSHTTPALELTLFFSAHDAVGGASGDTQPNQPMGAFLHTSVHDGSQQGPAQPTGPYEGPSRPTALLETGHPAQLELHLNASQPLSDSKPKEESPDDKLLSASSQPLSAANSSTSAMTWKSTTVAQTTPSHPEADQSHSSHAAATDQSFVPTKGPIFTPPRGVNATNGSLPTRATNGISSAVPELAVCQCKARFHISCLCGLSTGNSMFCNNTVDVEQKK